MPSLWSLPRQISINQLLQEGGTLCLLSRQVYYVFLWSFCRQFSVFLVAAGEWCTLTMCQVKA